MSAIVTQDPFENQDIEHLQRFVYLLPVVGFLPAFWTLYRRNGTRSQRNLSRLAITLALGWLASYTLLAAGTEAIPSMAVPLLLANSVVTSSYFLINFWLMVRLWQRKPIRLPLVSSLSDRLP